jgi:hypothetical protein
MLVLRQFLETLVTANFVILAICFGAWYDDVAHKQTVSSSAIRSEGNVTGLGVCA